MGNGTGHNLVAKYSDLEINNLIAESKPLALGWRSQIRMRDINVNKTGDFDVEGINKNNFRVILRKNSINQLDFSIILGFSSPTSTKLFNLRRYDGKSHEHTNPIEKQKFYDFHIHKATERYQNYGNYAEDKYAEVTDRFSSFGEAFECLLKDCAFELPDDPQLIIPIFN